MSIASILAIYFLFWFMCLFVVLPWGVRTADEAGVAKVPGQADSAPAHFPAGRVILRTSLLAAGLFGLYYANYHYGWLTLEMLQALYPKPPA
jgi:predicted secreted protein